MSKDGSKQGVNVETALRQWPEPPVEAPDARVAAIMARLDPATTDGTVEGELSDDELFGAPLPKASEEGAVDSHPERPARRSGGGLREMTKELTRMAKELGSAPAPASSRTLDARTKLDSGIVDLAAAAAADPGGAARAQTTPLASEDLFGPPEITARAAPEPEPGPEPASTRAASEVAAPAPRLVAVAAPASSSSTKTDPPKAAPAAEQAKVRERILGAFAAFAAAAALFLLMRQPQSAQAPSATGAPLAAAPAASMTVATPTDPALAKAPPPPAPAVVDPSALPAAPPADGTGEKLALAGKSPAAAKPGAARAPAAAAPPVKAAEPPADKPQQLATGPSDLNAAMRSSTGGDDKEKTPAASLSGSGSMGNVPQKPSQGAVTGALGAVLPQARGCLGPDDPISRAAIVFTSNGTVQSVSVSGAAAGTDVEACIKAALTKAKIQPFAEPTYTANVTIRH